jgi:hypothetical protein
MYVLYKCSFLSKELVQQSLHTYPQGYAAKLATQQKQENTVHERARQLAVGGAFGKKTVIYCMYVHVCEATLFEV